MVVGGIRIKYQLPPGQILNSYHSSQVSFNKIVCECFLKLSYHSNPMPILVLQVPRPCERCDSIIAVSRLRIINIVMIGCCHRNHLSPRLVLIQRILLVTKTTKLCLSECAHKHTEILTEILYNF